MKALLLAVLLISSALVAGSPVSGSTTCPSSGVLRVRTTSDKVPTYTIQAPVTNTGNICWGSPTITTATGPCLMAGMSYTAPTQGNSQSYDLSTVFIACTVNTDVIKWVQN